MGSLAAGISLAVTRFPEGSLGCALLPACCAPLCAVLLLEPAGWLEGIGDVPPTGLCLLLCICIVFKHACYVCLCFTPHDSDGCSNSLLGLQAA